MSGSPFSQIFGAFIVVRKERITNENKFRYADPDLKRIQIGVDERSRPVYRLVKAHNPKICTPGDHPGCVSTTRQTLRVAIQTQGARGMVGKPRTLKNGSIKSQSFEPLDRGKYRYVDLDGDCLSRARSPRGNA